MIIRKFFSVLILTAGLAAAKPVLEVDNTTFNAGLVAENSTIKAAFRLTNTGTQTLKITSVRPGCGCTVVKYDSIIAPGKTVVLEPAVDLKGMRPGYMSRGVNVTTNAPDSPTLNLIIAATIMSVVEVSENYIDFGGETQKTLMLTSAKKDLKVTGIIFKPHSGGNAPNWAANIPLEVKYKLAAADTVRADGLKVYRLTIDAPTAPAKNDSDAISGAFQIQTNHPGRKEIVITGIAR